ncbi:hypothetical protein ABZW18_22655 [Streptomyces sp. NPDC004647]|uniref:hypothetical protein n=1 Tax=Streptomyces sp. NPDC004647 TaxID=3154671 RepID=UPI0033A69A0D
MGSSAITRTGGSTALHMLGIYLNDHLAGATAGVELSRRIAHEYRHSRLGGELERLADEIAQDRESLLRIMDALGVPARRYKIYGGWVGERIGRLKPNGRLRRRSGLSTVIELEGMRLGVEGKSLLWRTLETAAAGEPRLDTDQIHELLDRARRQIEALESLRISAVSAILTPAPEE